MISQRGTPMLVSFFFLMFPELLRIGVAARDLGQIGPSFTVEPKDRVRFYNSTGVIIPCSATGVPQPVISWIKQDGSKVQDITKLLHIRTDGSLVFSPFPPEKFRQDIHAATYKCTASNVVGIIGSREVNVRAVIREQYEIRTYDDFVVKGNTAVLKCYVPNSVKDFVKVISWETDDGYVVQKGSIDGKMKIAADGSLIIENTDLSDGKKRFRCLCRDEMNKDTVTSTTWGQLIVTEPTTLVIPRIRSGDHEVKFVAGGSSEMNCIAQGYPVPSYTWYKQDGPRLIPLANNRRFQVVRSKLLLHKARPHDAGTYICVANNTAGDDRVHIQLILDEPLRVSAHPQRLTVKEGATVTFACNVSGPPVSSLTWTKNLKPVVVSTRSKLISSDVLQIYAVQREDRGMYQCFVRSHDMSAQGSAQLSLEEDPPEFREVFPDQLLRPGSRVSLRCLVTGNPLPQVSWRIYSRPVLESPSLRIGDFVDAQGVLTSFINISNANSEHGGLYSCHARNEIGAISHSAKLSVYGAPYVHAMDNMTVVTGDDIHVDCAVSGYPTTSIKWIKNNTSLTGGPRVTDYKNGTLSIAQTTKDDQGWYRCEITGAQNDKAEGSIFIKVTERPMINPFQFSDDLVENMRSMVLCNVLAGEPPIHIVWLKDGAPLLHSSQREGIHVSSLGEFASSLTIPSVTRHHAGNYTCLVTSGVAQTSYTATMTVRASPRWVKKAVDQEAVVGQKVIFSCQAEGIPEPVHRWKYKPDDSGSQDEFRSVISSSHMYVLENGSLVIKDVEKGDAGSYLCEANNGVGTPLSAVVRLSVNVPPRFNQSFEVRTVQEKQEVTLSCQPSGEAPITLKWKRYQRPIDRSVLSRYVLRENVISSGVRSEVTIPSVLRTDSGLFSCEASNAYGKDEKSIQLIVQAPPESPDGLQLLQVTSRQVTFSWAVPSSGNSPITGYVVVYNKSRAQDDPLESVRISATETKVTLTNLLPGTTYVFRVHAENAIGQSAPSQELTATTHEEAPSHAPQQVRASAVSSTAVKVTWKSPVATYSNDLLGYYVGTRDVSSSEPVVYKTVDFSKEDAMNEALITNLRRHTKYAVTVQAYNSKGTGPVSKEVFVQTLEHDPPKSPSLRVENTSSFSIQLSWAVEDLTPITGYILQYRSESGDWAQESHVAPQRTSATIKNLRCGTKYHFILSAFNSAGRGEPSDEVTAETSGGAAVAPEKSTLLSVNSTSALLRLSSWQDSGCPILYFVVQYKPQLQGDWILLSNNIVPAQSTVVITDLTPGTWYDLLMAAHNDAGTTEAEYVFSTLTSAGATVPPLTSYSPSSVMSFLRDPTVLVPIVCAVVVVIVITVVVAMVVVLRRKDTPSDCRSQGVYSGSSGGKGENLSMSSYGKVKRCEQSDDNQREPLYYPTPYATAQLSTYSESPDMSQCNTLRRHDGKGHDYDIPHRHTQMSDYTPYAKLWTRQHQNPEAAGDVQLMTMTPNDGHLNTLLHSYVGVESDSDDIFACPVTDANDAEEFSETECDRHHKWILYRDSRIPDGFEETILTIPRVC